MNIVLLDLNCTWVICNGSFDWKTSETRIPQEQYRTWLIDYFNAINAYVIMITARKERWKEATLARTAALTDGWQPNEAIFKPNNTWTHVDIWKPMVVQSEIFNRFVTDDSVRYIALESNSKTRTGYAQIGVYAVPVKQVWAWRPDQYPEPRPIHQPIMFQGI